MCMFQSNKADNARLGLGTRTRLGRVCEFGMKASLMLTRNQKKYIIGIHHQNSDHQTLF
jgi:hypothetical protein